jgi:hypothetical protein
VSERSREHSDSPCLTPDWERIGDASIGVSSTLRAGVVCMQPVGVRTQAGLSIRNCSECRGAHYEVKCIGEVDAAKSCVGLRGEHGARGMEDVFDTVGSPRTPISNWRGHKLRPTSGVAARAHRPTTCIQTGMQLGEHTL